MALRVALAGAVILMAAVGGASAQEASGYVEFTAGRSHQEAEDPNGTVLQSQGETFLQRYSLDLSWRFFPNIRFVAGGVFERNAADMSGDFGDGGATTQRLSPYLNLLMRTPLYSAQLGYYRTEDKLKANGLVTRDTQEVYNSVLGWRPEDLPEVTLRLSRTNNFDKERLSVDTTNDIAELISTYSLRDRLEFYYRGSFGESKDRVEDTTIDRTNHAGRVSYADDWLDRRIQFAAEYDITYKSTEVRTAGSGEVVTLIFASQGLSLLTVTPTTDPLVSNPALIDGNQVASAGIDLGLPPVGGDTRPRNIGLDMATPMELNTLYLWVDRELPQDIADAFSWDVYTSSDNMTWVLRQNVAPADIMTEIGQPPLVQPRTRFEIRFSRQTSRYIKVVTRPLDNSVASASSWPNIFVTELSAAISVPAEEAEGRSRQTVQRVSTNLRARLLARPMLYYEMTYTARDDERLPYSYTLSNGFSLRHAFDPVYSVTARVAREDGRDRDGDRTEYIYTASVRAVPVETLQHSLVFSGKSSDFEGITTDTSSVFLYSTAELYRGVTTNVSLGKSYASGSDGGRTETTQVSALATLIPHATTTFNLLFDSRRAQTESAASFPVQDRTIRSAQASVSYRPVPTLYLFYSYRMEHQTEADDRFLRNYSASWSPFPGGSLQLLFRYDETYRSELQSLYRVVSPRLRWNLSDRWYVDVGYEQTRYESNQYVTKTEAVTGTMRMWF